MTQLLGKITADFETQLAAKISVGGTTGTLSSVTDDDGVTLPSGRYFFTIDKGNSKKEHISCSLSGTALTNIKTCSRQGTETAGVLREHRVGANVIISDFAHIKKINDLLDGTTSFDSATVLGYDGTPSITTGNQLATKTYVDTKDALDVQLTGDQTITSGVKTFVVSPIVPTPTTASQATNKSYVDGVAVAGAPNASTTVKGIVEEATQAEIEAQTGAGATAARLFINPSTFLLALRSILAIQTSTATTTSLTTVASQSVIVIAKGRVGTGSHTVTLSYGGVVKDTTTVVGGNASDVGCFVLMWSAIPGAATADIVISEGIEIQVIILKI